MAALKYSELQSRSLTPFDYEPLQKILDDKLVGDFFYELYAPPRVPRRATRTETDSEHNAAVAREHWESLDRRALRLHRIGSTSFILEVDVAVLSGMRLALKCLLFPYGQVKPIADATRDYAIRYPPGQVPDTAIVHSSSPRWILMDFIDGLTLREYLAEHDANVPGPAPTLRIDMLRTVGTQLLKALRTLHDAGMRHYDLTPTNVIIVTKESQVDRVVLIDLGVNYLYSSKIRIAPSTDALYVAPEVRDDRPGDRSDLYSFGCILIDLLDPAVLAAPIVPDVIYQDAPEIARFIDDLIDADPRKRLLLFGSPDGSGQGGPGNGLKVNYAELLAVYQDILLILHEERNTAYRLPRGLQRFSGLVTGLRRFSELYTKPFSGQVKYHWQASRAVRRKRPGIAEFSSYLLFWSAICALSWYRTFLVCVDWALRDFGLDDWALGVNVIQRLAHSGSNLPLIDSLRASNYLIGDWRVNMPVRVLGLCTGIAMTKFYQNILGSLTARAIPGALARFTEFFSRLMSFWVLPPMLAANLWQPLVWPWLLVVACVPVAATTFCSRISVSSSTKTDSPETCIRQSIDAVVCSADAPLAVP
jgi:serine/threonine protein kinase